MSQLPGTPLTSQQRDIWVATAQFPDIPQYTLFIHERFCGPLDLDLLRECLLRAVARNDALQQGFGEVEGVPYQYSSPDDVGVQVVDLREAVDPSAAVDRWLDEAATVVYDIARQRPLDLVLLRESEQVNHVYVRTHHIACDAWGLQLFMGQVRADYEHVLRTGRFGDLEAPSFAAVAQELALQQDARRDDDRDHFRRVLSGVQPALFPRRAPQGLRRTGRHSFRLERALISGLKESGESPFVFITSAVALYLARVHQTDDVVLGIPLMNRSGQQTKKVVGEFANTLPLRVAVGGGPVDDLTAQVRESTRELLRHQRLALGDVPRDLPGPVAAPLQLFDTTISYLRWPRPTPVPGLEVRTVAQTHAHDQDALAIWLYEFDGMSDVIVDMEYACDVFDDDFPIEAAARHIETLVRELHAAPERVVTAVPMLADSELHDLLVSRNDTAAPFPSEATLGSLFDERVATTPDETALIAPDGGRVTFAELAARAGAVAATLGTDGVGPGDRVAVLVERGVDLLVAVLGVVQAGAAYVPVDPGYPLERIRLLLGDSSAKATLVGPTTADLAQRAGAVSVRDVSQAGPSSATPPVPAPATAGDLAYVIYTSGSTGQPKGVMVEHRSAINRLWWMQRAYPIGPGDVLLQKTPASFDVSVWELFWWTFSGARLSVAPPGAERDPAELLRVIARDHVTVVHFVPSMLGPFLTMVETDPAARRASSSLRQIFCSGEALPPARVEQFHRVFADGRTRLTNLYGPTEAAVDVTAHDCVPGPTGRVPIGRPIDNMRTYVLGQHGPQPVGAPGELCLAGVGVARGYLDRPELTGERFTEDPFVPQERMYRTGDVARWLADGTLEYLGRLDDQVKIRGNRVELGEVANALARVDGVHEALVVDRRDDARGVHLVGYYTAGADLDPRVVRAELARSLPDHMLPHFFVRLPAIPLTANGKADRRALPEPTAVVSTNASPRDEVQAGLAAVWAEALGLNGVGVHDNYFAIGGDSILMLRVRAAAEQRGLHFSVADLVRNPTIAELARHVTSGPAGSRATLGRLELVSDVDRPRLVWAEDAFPVSQLALGMVFHSALGAEDTSTIYHDVFRYRFDVEWDEAAFRGALDVLVQQHAALRSAFDIARYSEPLQLVHRAAPGGLVVTDLRGLPSEVVEERVDAHVEERRRHHYDLGRPPLYQFAPYVSDSPTGCRLDLVFSFHHAILDGWSAATLVHDLLDRYRQLQLRTADPVAPQPSPSPALHVQAELRAITAPEVQEHWRTRLAGAEMTALDSFQPHEPPSPDGFSSTRVHLAAGLEERLREQAVARGLPVRSWLLAAHCLTLRWLAGADDVVTGVVTHNRPEVADGDRMVGLFLNTAPLRVDLRQQTWLDVVVEVNRTEQADHPYRTYPLSAVQDIAGGLPSTAFNYVDLHVLQRLQDLDGVVFHGMQVWEETNFALFVNAIVDSVEGSLYLRVDTDGQTLSPSQARLFGTTFVQVLERLVAEPEGQLDPGFLAPPRAAPTHATPLVDVITRWENQVDRRPDAPAVSHGDREWTHRQLAEVSGSVAAHLLREGAGHGATIGVAVDRSPELIAVVLGIVRAGLVCVPLDVSYPAHRLQQITEDVRPFRVIAHPDHAHVAGDPSIVLLVGSVTTLTEPVELAEPSLDDLACILFTSGSTGRPKGVELTRRMWANYVQWQLGVPSGAVGASTLQFAPLSFDMSFQEIFSTLAGGGSLRLVSDEDRLDSAALLRLLDRYRVERVLLPFVALQRLAEASDALGVRPSALRVIVSSGEQLRVTEEIRRLCEALPGVLLENQYGPTETHQVTSFSMTGDPRTFPLLPPIGAPLGGVELHVLDPARRPVPVGASGEIYVGGDCLARGYHRRPEVTEEKFVSHPWQPGDRLYRTGDLGRRLPDGTVVWLGRADDQVKVRGFRIEPAEVELAIMRVLADRPGVRGAAVVPRRRSSIDSFLAAFLLGAPDSVSQEELVTRLRRELPEFMVPSHLAWLEEFPLTPSGKRDDAALRALPLSEPRSSTRVPPRDEYEGALASLVAEVLGRDVVGVEDDFFQLGGTSLTAMRLSVLIEQRYQVNVPLAAFIAAPTIATLADRLRSQSARLDGFDPLVPIRSAGDRSPLFLIHPLGGHVLCYLKLARHLPADQPVFALQAAGTEAGGTPLGSIQEMAASYLAAMRKVQPRGPYLVGGWSFGGFVAFEMARQLRASDTQARLIVLDSITIDRGRQVQISDDALLEFFLWELLWFEHSETPSETFPESMQTVEQKLDFIVERAMSRGVVPAGTSRAAVRRLFEVFRANWQALIEYTPPVVDQDVVLLRAEGSLPDSLRPMHDAAATRHEDAANGWREWTSGRLDVIDVPGDHLVLMDEPSVAVVAEHVTEFLTAVPEMGGTSR